MREKGQTEAAKTLETPVFSRGIEILTEKMQLAIIHNGRVTVMNEMNDKIIGNVEKELDEIEIIDTESIEEKLSFIVYGTIVCC